MSDDDERNAKSVTVTNVQVHQEEQQQQENQKRSANQVFDEQSDADQMIRVVGKSNLFNDKRNLDQ